MIFWYFPPDYWKFMDFSERVNFRIMKEFSEAGIEFAFPTTTTILEQPDGQSPSVLPWIIREFRRKVVPDGVVFEQL